MTRHPNNNFYRVVVVFWLTLSVASVILAALTWMDLSRRIRAAKEAVTIQSELDGILRLLVDAETAQRGYTIAGEEAFLQPLAAAESNLPPHFDRLTHTVNEDPVMLKGVMELRAQAELSMNHQRNVVATRKAQGGQAAADIVATGEGKRIMDGVRSRIGGLRDMRAGLVSDSDGTARGRLFRASLTSLVAGILGIGAGALAFWLSHLMLGHQERERTLMQAKLQAERSSQEKTVFLANMSHEIRTPMNAILGFTELLEGDLRETRHRQYLRSIRSAGASLLQLINDILDMSKIEAGVMELRLEPTDPREICDFLHTIFSGPAARKGVKLECSVAQDLPHALLMDRIRLRQVLVNLVGNAVKFTDRGNIYVRVQWEKQKTSSHVTLVIEVQDTGVGIPQDKLEAIFKPFVQAGAHREKEKTGTGLGLAIVKRLTEKMGGTVTAASVVGQGSAFSLRFLDVAISARLAEGEKLERGEPTDFNELRSATVLVVDDNETNCLLVAGMFATSHHRLLFAGSGSEAVDKARDAKPDVILLDIRMPGMDGRETLTEIRKIPGAELTPVIAVTASSLMGEENDLKERFSGYVRKPFSKRELFDELAHFLPSQTKDAKAPEPAPIPLLAAPPELLAELRRLQRDEWPAIRDSLAVNETRAFAVTLDTLGQRWNCQPLLIYAQTLSRHAENYAVVDMEKKLHDFGGLVEHLEKSQPA